MSGAAREQFEELLYRLKEMIVLGEVHLAIAHGIIGYTLPNPEIQQIAPTFWRMTLTAHIDVAHLLAYKVFDTDRNATSLKRLLEMAEKQETFQCVTPKRVREIVAAARAKIENLDRLKVVRDWRNNILAHNSFIRHQMGRQASDVSQVLSATGNIVDEVSLVFRGSPVVAMEYVRADDHRKLFDFITEAKRTRGEAGRNEQENRK
jgi:hypothetical protein